MKTGIELIAKERKEQIEKHGFDTQYDLVNNEYNQLIEGAIRIIKRDKNKPMLWNEELWLKMINKSYEERLIIAGALIAAEIDRLHEDQ